MKKHGSFLFYLSALQAFAPFSTDCYLASLPQIQVFFSATISQTQLTLSLFLFGLAIGQLMWGPMSDRIGRKSTLCIGLLVYFISSILCVKSLSITMLIIMRFLQSIGASSATVVSIAMIKDEYPEEKVPQVMAIMLSVMILAPIIAPIIGSQLTTYLGWQSIFIFLALYSVAILLLLAIVRSNYQIDKAAIPSVTHIARDYYLQIKTPSFLLSAMMSSLTFALLFIFIASSSFIYQHYFDVKPVHFGYYFAANAFGLFLACNALPRLIRLSSPAKIAVLGSGISLVFSLIMLLLLLFLPHNTLSLLVPMFFISIGIGFSMPSYMSIALMHVRQHAGLAAALIGSMQFLFAALTASTIGFFIQHHPYPFSIVMSVISLCIVLLIPLLKKTTQQPS